MAARGITKILDIRSTAEMLDAIGTLDVQVSTLLNSMRQQHQFATSMGAGIIVAGEQLMSREWNPDVDPHRCKAIIAAIKKGTEGKWVDDTMKNWQSLRTFLSSEQLKRAFADLDERTNSVIKSD